MCKFHPYYPSFVQGPHVWKCPTASEVNQQVDAGGVQDEEV